jgi:hypothetical protein
MGGMPKEWRTGLLLVASVAVIAFVERMIDEAPIPLAAYGVFFGAAAFLLVHAIKTLTKLKTLRERCTWVGGVLLLLAWGATFGGERRFWLYSSQSWAIISLIISFGIILFTCVRWRLFTKPLHLAVVALLGGSMLWLPLRNGAQLLWQGSEDVLRADIVSERIAERPGRFKCPRSVLLEFRLRGQSLWVCEDHAGEIPAKDGHEVDVSVRVSPLGIRLLFIQRVPK